MRLLRQGIHASVSRMRRRYNLSVAFVSGIVGGMAFAFFAHAEYEISSGCAPFAAHFCDVGYIVEQSPDQSHSTAFSPILDYPLLLGGIWGGMMGVAIAPHLRTYLRSIRPANTPRRAKQNSVVGPRQIRHAALLDHAIDSGAAPLASSGSPIDLTQFRSSEIELTPKQRDILQCLWLMAAIAPHPDCATLNAFALSALPSQASGWTSSWSINDSKMTWEWVFDRIQSSTTTFDDVSAVLTELGFSKQTILMAWHIALDGVGNQST